MFFSAADVNAAPPYIPEHIALVVAASTLLMLSCFLPVLQSSG